MLFCFETTWIVFNFFMDNFTSNTLKVKVRLFHLLKIECFSVTRLGHVWNVKVTVVFLRKVARLSDKNKFLELLKPFCAPMFRYFINFFSTQLILAIIVSCNVVSPIRQKVKILHRGLKYHEFRWCTKICTYLYPLDVIELMEISNFCIQTTNSSELSCWRSYAQFFVFR